MGTVVHGCGRWWAGVVSGYLNLCPGGQCLGVAGNLCATWSLIICAGLVSIRCCAVCMWLFPRVAGRLWAGRPTGGVRRYLGGGGWWVGAEICCRDGCRFSIDDGHLLGVPSASSPVIFVIRRPGGSGSGVICGDPALSIGRWSGWRIHAAHSLCLLACLWDVWLRRRMVRGVGRRLCPVRVRCVSGPCRGRLHMMHISPRVRNRREPDGWWRGTGAEDS